MIHEKVRKRIATDKIVTGINCDICGDVIADSEIEPRYFYKVTAGHDEWGNDSPDSIECRDVCSGLCLQRALDKYLKMVKMYETAYFHVDREPNIVRNYLDLDFFPNHEEEE